jgi:hypothetical protein
VSSLHRRLADHSIFRIFIQKFIIMQHEGTMSSPKLTYEPYEQVQSVANFTLYFSKIQLNFHLPFGNKNFPGGLFSWCNQTKC